MSGFSVTRDTFRMMVAVPEELVGLPADDEWAAWIGLTSGADGDRTAVVLVSITVTALDGTPGAARAADSVVARIRARHAEGGALIEEFTTPDAFKAYASIARAKGFLLVAASPLTRSSHHAGEDFQRLRAARGAKLAQSA